jgi:nucleoside-specific outer membrane channel protein Tsx
MSTLRSKFLSLVVLAVAGGAAQGADAVAAGEAKPDAFFLWTDSSLKLTPYGWGFAIDPSEQSNLTFEHAHESAIGDLYLFLDVAYLHGTTSGDDEAVYGEFSPRLSLGKMLDRDLSFALFGESLFEFKDVFLAAQYERGEDPDLAEAVLLGIGFNLDVRKAGLLGPLAKFRFIQLNLYGRSELASSAVHGFKDMQVTLVAAYPITLGRVRLLVDGFFDWVLGLGPENSSFHLNPLVSLDVGNFWGRADQLRAGVGFDFWWNKYQIPHSAELDTNQAAVTTFLKWHF